MANRTKTVSTQTDQLPVYITQNKIQTQPIKTNIRTPQDTPGTAILRIGNTTDSPTDRKALINAQRRDPELARIIHFLENGILTGMDAVDRQLAIQSEFYCLKHALLYRVSLVHYSKDQSKHDLLLYITEDKRHQTALKIHDQAHIGILKLYLPLRQQYYSTRLRQIVQEVVSSCPKCQINKPLPPKRHKNIQMRPLPTAHTTLSSKNAQCPFQLYPGYKGSMEWLFNISPPLPDYLRGLSTCHIHRNHPQIWTFSNYTA